MEQPQRQRPLSPHLQVYKPQYTMVLSFSHRIAGIVLSAGSLLLVYWLWAIASGEQRYERAVACLSGVWVKLLMLALMFCFFFHLCNGIRHLFWDLGYGYEKREARLSGWLVVIMALALTVAGAYLALHVAGRGIGGEV